jgi:hypothetical protein
MTYTIKNLKTWNTWDGGGYSCTLYCDGEKIALVLNEGVGGETQIMTLDVNSPKVEIDTWFNKETETQHRAWVTPNYAKLDAYCKTLPKWDCLGELHHMEPSLFIEELISETNYQKKVANAKKKGTPFKLEGDDKFTFSVLNTLDQEVVINYLEKNHPNKYQLI